jgi:hypothetical protein
MIRGKESRMQMATFNLMRTDDTRFGHRSRVERKRAPLAREA